MIDTGSFVKAVKQILMQDWDSIGVQSVAQAQDEYDAYTAQLAGMILRGASQSDLVKYLIELEKKAMGFSGDRSRALFVAEKLWRVADR